jgi:hypothetical protein
MEAQSMNFRFALVTAALVATASIAVAGSAGAATKAEPSAQVVGNVKINNDGTGTVKARYICSGPAEEWHLWVSAKQTADGSFNPAVGEEGSGFGGVADIWLQSHPTDFSCDGKWHTQKFEINTDEAIPAELGGGTVGRGELVPGVAWVQFCLINEANEIFLIDQDWQKVRG